ncbi:hypothetical protein F2Q69_00058958 [Brassica cretica]|uniref:Aspartic peptidase DDI1-type domain-containing protein n=1 Tax=Brassica cretica TaxID=69181 RepID=A0A8S9RE72_BRACR|nr:hypothetical protein F2Q69_00058958 [Brassica cretica]
MSSSEDKTEVSKDKHEDRRKMVYFREAINSTKGRKGKSKPPLGGVYKDVEERESFQNRVFKIPLEKPFEEAYFTHILWMFFRETRETEEDIRIMFCEDREKMKKRITLKKKSDHGQFAIQCTVKGIEFPHAFCDIGASVSILPRVMARDVKMGLGSRAFNGF